MNCPVCKSAKLSKIELENNLAALNCCSCGGHWLSAKDYFAWLEKKGEVLQEKPFSEIDLETNDAQDAKLCPDCGHILIKYKVGHGLDFFVDNCNVCNGVWLDKNEWAILKDKNLHDEIHRVFTTAWQKGVRDDKMKEKFEELYSNRFGAEGYQRIKEFRTWMDENPQRVAILAYLKEADPYKL